MREGGIAVAMAEGSVSLQHRGVCGWRYGHAYISLWTVCLVILRCAGRWMVMHELVLW